MPNKISNRAIKTATTKSWNEWFDILNEETQGKHRDIVDFLIKNYALSSLWSQRIAAEYEKWNGEIVSGGFEVGVKRTFPVPMEKAWEIIVSREGIEIWLGRIPKFKITRGRVFRTSDGTRGKFRVYQGMDHIRLTWQPETWEAPSILQIRIIPAKDDHTTISFHQENLKNEMIREQMREHWKNVLDQLEQLI